MEKETGRKPGLHKKHVARLERERQQGRLILYVFIGILASVLLLLGYGYLDIKYFQLQRPVAKVGEVEITAGEFEARVRLQRQQLLMQYSQYSQYGQILGMDVTQQLQEIQTRLDDSELTGQSVLDQMVEEELIRQEAAKRGIVISEEELNGMMQDAFGFYPNGTPTPSVTPTAFTLPEIPEEAFTIVTKTPLPSPTSEFTATPEAAATVEAQATTTVDPLATSVPATNTPAPTATLEPTATATVAVEPTLSSTSTPLPTATPYTLEGYQTQIADAAQRLEKLGIEQENYKSLFEIQFLRNKLIEEITADLPRSEEQIWARHILVADETVALNLIEQLNKGADFAELAKAQSTDTGSGANGGDLGWFGKGAMVPEFETAAFALEKPGDYTTTPAQSQFGFHIIQLIAKQDRPLSSTQYDNAKNAAFEEWLVTAREEYKVETFDLWKQHLPTEPNFVTIATESAIDQLTARAKEATATPQ